MKRLALILMVIGGGYLLVGTLLLIVPLDLRMMQKALAVIGSYGMAAQTILRSLSSGLLISGALLLAVGAAFLVSNRKPEGTFGWPRRWFVALVIGFQMTIAAAYMASLPYHTVPGDDAWYYHQANHLAHGAPLIWNHAAASPKDGEPTAFWPIGYPVVLSLFFRIFGPQIWAGQLLNLLLLAGITLVTYHWGKSLFGSQTANRAVLVVALTPSLILISLALLSDLLFTFLLLLLLYLTQRRRKIMVTVLIGLLYGLAAMTRPVALFLPLLICIYWILRDREIKGALVHLIIIFAVGEMVLLPWQIRNYRVFGQFVAVSNNGGHNFWMGNNPYTPCHGPMATFIAGEDTLQLMRNMNEAQRYDLMFRIGLDYALSHPLKTVLIWPKKLFFLYFKDSQAISWAIGSCFEMVPGPIVSSLYLFTDGFYYALGLAFLVSAFGLWRRGKLSASLMLVFGILLYFSLVYLPFITECRYHLPLLPLFALVAVHKPPEGDASSTAESQ